ncbi:hypothetical protein [Phenylobacterium sp.]|uniref:hypothetical protein n=1 Tax=Phenylobacterium sp. TaxID=1871053 RepID=UPI002621247D|nr:hypothetical protein [Phenylobacterium sp.]
MLDRHNLRLWAYSGVAFIGAIPIMVAPHYLIGPGHPAGDPLRIVVMTASAVAAVAWGFTFATLGFRHADEYIRERSKFAWYWGGLIGIAASAPVYAFVGLGGQHWLNPANPMGTQVFHAFALGYSLPILAQLLGFIGVYLWWKATKR